MHNVRNITEDLYWIGANDRRLALFENIHPIPEGVSYNSYMLLDKETVVFDTVDWSVTRQYIENIEYLLNGRELDYLVVHHMEPDHCASIEELAFRYPKMKIISSEKGFMFMRQFGYKSINGHQLIEAKEGDKFKFGKHEILFLEAPMVHWPEVLVSLDITNGALFSADAFGSFKSLDGRLFNDEVNWDRDWLDEGRRYLTNIVGKYGPHIQYLLKKAAPVLDKIKFICPLHGVVWRNDFGYLIDKYDKWSRYEPEEKGVLIAYASMYGNTENAIEILAKKLAEKGITNIKMYDVSNTHVSYLISDLFKYSHLVIASPTYNLGIYPVIHNFVMDMKALNLQNRTVAIVENGSWARKSGDLLQEFFETQIKDITVLNERVGLTSSANNVNLDAWDYGYGMGLLENQTLDGSKIKSTIFSNENIPLFAEKIWDNMLLTNGSLAEKGFVKDIYELNILNHKQAENINLTSFLNRGIGSYSIKNEKYIWTLNFTEIDLVKSALSSAPFLLSMRKE